jgi:hypothetical protein
MSVLPWRTRGDWPIPDFHRSQPLDEGVPISTIVIANQIPWSLVPREGIRELPRNPLGPRMRRDLDG